MSRPLGDDALREIEEQTPVGLVYLHALMRRQLRHSLVIAGALVAVLLAQPLIAHFIPAYAAIRVLGIPLPWLLLGAGAYPVMVLLGYLYVREAEATDDDFADLLVPGAGGSHAYPASRRRRSGRADEQRTEPTHGWAREQRRR